MNVNDYLYNCEKMIANKKMHYLYGYKGETITKEYNRELKRQYPNVWTYAYLTRADNWIGDKAIDCSGFVQVNCNGDTEIGSYYMGEHWESIGKSEFDTRKISGLIGWRSGHVVVFSGRHENGLCEIMEASGQKTGLRKRWANIDEFKKILINPNVEYTSEKYKVGWNRDDKGWWYSPDGETYLADGYFELNWSSGKDLFFFDSSGYCVITDSNGVILEPKSKEFMP